MSTEQSIPVTIRILPSEIEILSKALPNRGIESVVRKSPGQVIKHIVKLAIEDLQST